VKEKWSELCKLGKETILSKILVLEINTLRKTHFPEAKDVYVGKSFT
jgi:hypothetical protein